jgi:uncharacterized protein (TIGR02145 family)
MAENLKTVRYRNGDFITAIFSDTEWESTTTGGYGVYENVTANRVVYGPLYNWYAVTDARGLCPAGWHVPSDEEWTTLVTELDPLTCDSCIGGAHSLVAGGAMKSTGYLGEGLGLWAFPNVAATNSSGFNGHPGGIRFNLGYGGIEFFGYWWSTTEGSSTAAWSRRLTNINSTVIRDIPEKYIGCSVRCLKD